MLNLIVIAGRLTADVEVIKGKESDVASFSLAFDQGIEDTGFIRCKAFGVQASTLIQYVHKGDKVAVSGRFYDSQFTRKDGTKGHEAQILVNSVEFIDVLHQDEEVKEEPKEEPKPVAKAPRTRR